MRVDWGARRDDDPLPIPAAWDGIPPRDLVSGDTYKHRQLIEEWDAYDSLHYNGLRRVKMLPTKFICPTTFNRMGISTQITTMLERVGLGTMALQPYPLCPELVRQCIASCQLRYRHPRVKIASEGELTFKLDGVFYALSFAEICRIYGFDASKERVSLPASFPLSGELWRVIAERVYNSKESVQNEIRHPVLRVFVKVIASTIVCKEEMSRMRVQELYFLHFAIGHLLDYTMEPPANDINFGALFSSILVDCKTKGIKGTEKETIGSLLTPIFHYVRARIGAHSSVDRVDLLDEEYFLHSKILAQGVRYNFHDHDRRVRQIQLPCALADISTLEALRFQPLAGDFVGAPAVRRGHMPSERGDTSSDTLPPPPAADSPDDVAKWRYVFDCLGKIYSKIAATRCHCSRDDVVHHPPPPSPPHFARGDRDTADDGAGGSAGGSGDRLPRTRSTSPSDHI